MIHLSENGEALYNKDFLEIVRYIKLKLPNTALNLLSNFGLLKASIAKALLKEKLLSSVQVNIDGHDAKSYKAVKGINYNGVIKNLKKFLELRQEYDPEFDFTINVMPASEYALTGAVFSRDRYAVVEAANALQNAAGNFYINDKPTGAVVGMQPFGGARASGTNDKAGSAQNLLRWVSPRTIKETFVTPEDYRYPFLG
jgi:hypothetical protein